LCGASPLPAPFLERRGVPVLQNHPRATQGEALAEPRGDLLLVGCERCGYLFNAAFDAERVVYAETYDNRQDCSSHFEVYLDEVIDHLVARYCLSGGTTLEVGCGKGAFLRRLCARAGCRGLGFDSSYVGPPEVGPVRFVTQHYGPGVGLHDADLICCRHVLEHVPDPLALLRDVRAGLGDADVGVFFEVPCVEWILARGVFWDFFYEHCSYFSAASLRFAFESAGFEVVAIQPAFAGQYLWVDARPAPKSSEPALSGGLSELPPFSQRVRQRLERTQAQLERFQAAGGCLVWGAGAKGTTLVNTLDPTAERVVGLVDVNPAKQGRFVPGTGHPILAPHELAGTSYGGVLVMNPNYLEEIAAELNRLGLGGLELTTLEGP
tara:strand:+ start:463 stop:1602 length:1140 start_codon:yes stop_codon:yes gene_type:complete